MTVLSWTGSVTGGELSAVSVSGLPMGWALKVNAAAQEMTLQFGAPGTVILVR
jgi:hypothetical protein